MDHFTFFNSLFGIPHHYEHVAGAVLVTILLSLVGLTISKGSKRVEDRVVPSDRLTVQNICELIIDFVRKLVKQITHSNRPFYVTLIGTTFIFILLSNLMGLIPGFLPPTESTNTNFAMALAVFVLYHYFGIREHGWRYLKQFTGGLTGGMAIFWILLIPIEIVGHVIRPASLTLRLWGNINGDHIVLGVFSGLVPLLIPVVFMFLGLLVSVVQALVFSLLSSVYIALAISHDH